MTGKTVAAFEMDRIARAALNGILGQSVEERKEYGSMIYVLDGACRAMPPRTQGDPTKVDVGQHEPNCGCPSGATPTAYYHTHPVYSIAGMKGQYNEFSEEDKDVARDHNLDAAYLGALDGSFLKFDCKQNRVIALHPNLKNTR